MYEFYYKYIGKNVYCAKLLVPDAHSLVFEIETETVYEHFYEHKNLPRTLKTFLILSMKS